MKKRVLMIISFVLVISMLVVACGGEGKSSNNDNGSKVVSSEGKRIVIVTSPSGVDDGSFNEDNFNGINKFIETHEGYTVASIQEKDIAASISAVESVIADYDIIVTPGFQFSGISRLAEDNLEKKFILVDSFPDKIGDKELFDNVYAMTFAEEESGFYAGIAAAFSTKTNKVAVVNGVAYPSNVNYQYGFMSGVNYANKHFGKAVEIVELKPYSGTDVTNTNVGGNYIGSFDDQSVGKTVGQALIDEGVDVMLVAAGGAGNGVFTAAKETDNVMIIGCDVDQYKDGESGNRNIILTSVLKNMAINVERSLIDINDGIFKGENVVLHADTDSTGYVDLEGHNQLDDEAKEALKDVYLKMKSGDIKPASNFNGHTPDEFPGI